MSGHSPEQEVIQFIKDLELISKYLFANAESIEELDKIHAALVGRKGILTQIQRELGRLMKEDRESSRDNI